MNQYCNPLFLLAICLSYFCYPVNNQLYAQDIDTFSKITDHKVDFQFKRIGTQEGLSQNTVYTILQDHIGFLWFGTEGGLNRFDGYNFVTFNPNPSDTNSISHGIIFSLYEDNAGTLWIGTANGLNRYNRSAGNFTRFEQVFPGEETQNGGVSYLLEDREKNLWLRTHEAGTGIRRFCINTGEVFVYDKDRLSDKGLYDKKVLALLIDSEGIVRIGTNRGLYSYNSEKDTFEAGFGNEKNSFANSEYVVTAILESQKQSGVYWIGTGDEKRLKGGHGLFRFNLLERSADHYEQMENSLRGLQSNFITRLYEDRVGRLWVGTTAGLHLINENMEVTHLLQPSSTSKSINIYNSISKIFEDNTGLLWVTSYGDNFVRIPTKEASLTSQLQMRLPDGLFCVDPKKNDYRHYRQILNDPASLSHNDIMSIYEDRGKSLWIGTFTGGISRIDHQKIGFRNFTNQQPFGNNINSNKVRSVYIDPLDNGNTLWIGTIDAGMNRINRSNGEIRYYQHDSENNNSLGNNRVDFIRRSHNGDLWIATGGGGLNLFDDNNETFRIFRELVQDTARYSLKAIGRFYEDPENPGIFWFTCEEKGIIEFNNLDYSFNHYPLNDIHAANIAKDFDGNFWIGSWGKGLLKFDPKQKKLLRRYQANPFRADSLISDFLFGLHMDNSGMLWIGTFDGGLVKFDPLAEKFVTIDNQSGLGLTSNTVYSILEDDHQDFWLTTGGGLFRYNRKQNNFTIFDIQDQLINRDHNADAYFQSEVTREIIIGGNLGASIFNPYVEKDTLPPPVVFTDFRVFNQSIPVRPVTESGEKFELIRIEEDTISASSQFYLPQDMSELDTLILSYQENVISFQFAALHYAIPGKNQYA